MPEIPFPPGIRGSADLPKSLEILKNIFNVGDEVMQRPGINQLGTAPGVSRGQFVYVDPNTQEDRLFQVSSQDLGEVDEAGNFTNIGIIDGVDLIDTAVGFNEAVIIDRSPAGVGGGKGYTFQTPGDVVTQITSVNFLPSNSVTHMNGRFIYVPIDGSPAFFSDIGDAGTIQGTSFFDAEQLPDLNKVAFNLNNLLYIGGTNSFEIFRDVGTGTVPYRRLEGRIEYGYISGLVRYQDTYMFIGREIDQDVGIYALGTGTAQKVSIEFIDEILITYTEAELEQVVANRFKWKGYDIATFRLPNHSFGFFQGSWFVIDTRIDNVDQPWQAGFINLFKQKYYTSFDNRIGRLEQINTDYGNQFERKIQLGFQQPNNTHFSIAGMSLVSQQGFESAGGSIGLRMSLDNVLYGDTFFRDVADLGGYADRLEWNYPGGLGYYYGYAGMEIVASDDVYFQANHLVVDLA